MKEALYTSDWFSHNQKIWESTIAPHLRAEEVPKILEVGVFEGRSCLWFLTNFPTSMLTVIDPWSFTNDASEDTYNRFISNIEPFKERVTKITVDEKFKRLRVRCNIY